MSTVPPPGDAGWPGEPGGRPPHPGGPPPYPGAGQVPYPGAGLPTYPGGPQGPAPRPPAPPTVRLAARLMLLGGAIGLVSSIIQIADHHQLRRIIVHAHPAYSPHQINNAVDALVGTAIVGGIVGAALWVWMAIANSRGNSWARIVATVFFGIDTIGTIVGVAENSLGVTKVLGVITWIIGLGAVILLWRAPSSAYFNRPKGWQ